MRKIRFANNLSKFIDKVTSDRSVFRLTLYERFWTLIQSEGDQNLENSEDINDNVTIAKEV